ncbi:hypothetical protein AYI70_g2960 [Smittium culicis]|uniref:Uncharacterized protein n=1 Tax=Smittium culicis TaxID=133412 RepID=A0A1R1Y5T4_9FUNG|nr:hypothetical protein AYI70_g3113 [Smittium culicis]OMJ22312.1 hypothetical protein AYI70_g2960 [Smittium culicis]
MDIISHFSHRFSTSKSLILTTGSLILGSVSIFSIYFILRNTTNPKKTLQKNRKSKARKQKQIAHSTSPKNPESQKTLGQ